MLLRVVSQTTDRRFGDTYCSVTRKIAAEFLRDYTKKHPRKQLPSFYSENMKERDHFGRLEVDGIILLKWV
jgi:hypothetical protein